MMGHPAVRKVPAIRPHLKQLSSASDTFVCPNSRLDADLTQIALPVYRQLLSKTELKVMPKCHLKLTKLQSGYLSVIRSYLLAV